DAGAAKFYLEQARALESAIEAHWNASQKLIWPTLDVGGGINYKNSGIDSAVILGVLHGCAGDGFYCPTTDKVLSTILLQERAFAELYPINRQGLSAVAIGRYPEDRYTGYDSNGQGNPWLLTTVAFGELYHRAASE